MGTFVLVSGTNNSGKSRFAEQLIAQTKGPRYYIATMQPCTEENFQRIEKHRLQRRELGFQTMECPGQIGDVPLAPEGVVLLEDVSNLLANAIFACDRDAESVFQDICRLQNRCRLLVAVTIAGLEENACNDPATVAYIRELNTLNQRLLARAEGAVTMRNQQPILQKGEIYALL